MSRFLSSRFSGLCEYIPGEQPVDKPYIKLNTNESPFPPSPEVTAVYNAHQARQLNLYPDPQGRVLSESIARHYGVKTENVLLTNGSDEALSFCFQAFCDEKTGVAYPSISYGFYSVFSQLYCLNALEIPLKSDFSIDTDDYCGINRTIVIANPNAPTGLALSIEQITRIVSSNPNNAVIIDEAYIDFGAKSALPLIERFDNLIIIQTCSKSRSLAGARLGYAMAQQPLIADLQKIRNSTNPYNVNRLTLAAGIAAFNSDDYYNNCCEKVMENRIYTKQGLEKLGFDVLQSYTNFLFARSDRIGGMELYNALKDRGVLVRWFNRPEIADFVRITIGTRVQSDILLQIISEVLK